MDGRVKAFVARRCEAVDRIFNYYRANKTKVYTGTGFHTGMLWQSGLRVELIGLVERLARDELASREDLERQDFDWTTTSC